MQKPLQFCQILIELAQAQKNVQETPVPTPDE